MLNCVILAGSDDQYLKTEKEKAFIELKNRPMIKYVIDALRESGYIEKIAVVGERQHLSKLDVDIIIDDKGSMLNNIQAGVERFKEDEMLLISTCDIPFLTGKAVADFIESALKLKSDLYYPIISRNVCEAVYPEAKRTYVKLKEGQFTGGNLLLINPNILDNCMIIAEQMINYRKSPIKMGRVLGTIFLIKLLVGRLTIKDAEKRVTKLLNIKAKAIISNYPEIGNDIDKPEHLLLVEKYLNS